ncbi:hypothetical protein GW17_00020422 [Ensete ventricosum]|uniref:Uncharacterized protein n=1 Tax=Ensete ventricosum TaxID=4639 RepID=A0A444EZE2_ENSVE|nr:hypothetical protein GW17_00020422 [Ensete ventricosum]RZR73408.1 hypothetical protein BHM03_00023810 [Ensete ventricosum]
MTPRSLPNAHRRIERTHREGHFPVLAAPEQPTTVPRRRRLGVGGAAGPEGRPCSRLSARSRTSSSVTRPRSPAPSAGNGRGDTAVIVQVGASILFHSDDKVGVVAVDGGSQHGLVRSPKAQAHPRSPRGGHVRRSEWKANPIGTIRRYHLSARSGFWSYPEVYRSLVEVPAQAVSVGGCSRPDPLRWES